MDRVLQCAGAAIAKVPIPACDWLVVGVRGIGKVHSQGGTAAGLVRCEAGSWQASHRDVNLFGLGIRTTGIGHRQGNIVSTGAGIGVGRVLKVAGATIAKVPAPIRGVSCGLVGEVDL